MNVLDDLDYQQPIFVIELNKIHSADAQFASKLQSLGKRVRYVGVADQRLPDVISLLKALPVTASTATASTSSRAWLWIPLLTLATGALAVGGYLWYDRVYKPKQKQRP